MKHLRAAAVATACITVLSIATAAEAAKATASIYLATAEGPGERIGTIEFVDTPEGLEIRPRLMQLREGTHGFHLYMHAVCGAREKDGVKVPALAAGGPVTSDSGAEIELPNLYVHYDGSSFNWEIAPNVKVADLYGHSVVLDALGPAYRDAPAPVGGAIRRVACGPVDTESQLPF